MLCCGALTVIENVSFSQNTSCNYQTSLQEGGKKAPNLLTTLSFPLPKCIYYQTHVKDRVPDNSLNQLGTISNINRDQCENQCKQSVESTQPHSQMLFRKQGCKK